MPVQSILQEAIVSVHKVEFTIPLAGSQIVSGPKPQGNALGGYCIGWSIISLSLLCQIIPEWDLSTGI